MKYFIMLVTFLICSCKNNKQTQILVENIKVNDSLFYSMKASPWETTGTYSANNAQGTILLLCEYSRIVPMLPLSDSVLNLLVKTGMTPEYGLKMVSGYQPASKFIPPEKIDYLSNKNKQTPVAYYQITEAPSLQPYHKLYKTTGRLYLYSGYGGNGGNFYVSDTTEKYGSFIIKTPPFIKPPAYALDAPQKLRVSSLSEKSKNLCGEYNKVSYLPYHIIRDEEVYPNKKIK